LLLFYHVGSIVSFQVGAEDAEFLIKQFGGRVGVNDLLSLRKYNAYLKLLIDGESSDVFSMVLLPPPRVLNDERRILKILNYSRNRYASSKVVVEKNFDKFFVRV